ncbi:MAG: hypothetical protein ACI9WU_001619 [Myxococcota bacterium]|jgi:hypothetical protein
MSRALVSHALVLSLWVLGAAGLSGCPEDVEPAALAGQAEGPPSSVEPQEPEPGGGGLAEGCQDVACCSDLLGVVDSLCQTVTLTDGECAVLNTDEGTECGDADGCTAAPACVDGACLAAEGDDCASLASGPCQVGVCDQDAGECTLFDIANGEPCVDDGDQCNGVEVCQSGECISGQPLSCDDDNACTADSCDPASGCVFTADVGAPCSDGNVCSHGDACDADGTCAPGDNVCACESDADCASVGDLCDAALVCSNQECVPGKGNPVACNDGDECTTGGCDPATGECEYKPTFAACDDGDPCTAGDQCGADGCEGKAKKCDDGDPCTDGDTCDPQSGECIDGTYTCDACATADDCPALPACGGEYTCDNGSCLIAVGSVVNCDNLSPLPCHAVGCDAATNSCVQKPVGDGTTCDDGNSCTQADACADGNCNSGAPLPCGDGDPCTEDACTPGSGCVNTPKSGTSCDDGNACTTGDACINGQCDGSAPVICDDGNACTKDSCDAALGCLFEVVSGAECSDDDGCTTGDACSDLGVCVPGPNTCGCSSDVDCVDDDNLCNGVPVCQNSECVGPAGSDVICVTTSLDPCKVSVCNPANGQCEDADAKNGTACDDNDQCTGGDLCTSGTCSGIGIACDDGNACTADSCVAGQGCVSVPAEGDCDDGNACTEGETCSGSSCAGGAPIDCTDGNLCTADSCLPATGCKYSDAVGACSDGDACTGNDACISGTCTGSTKACGDGNPCTDDSCDAASGNCVNAEAACDDANPCTTDSCAPETGCAHTALVCNDDDPCTDDSCDPASVKGCDFINSVCSDGDACTTDSCDANGGCAYPDLDCDDNSPCTEDSCVPDVGCHYTDTVCDGPPCFVGLCVPTLGCTLAAVNGDDNNACTLDSCDAQTGDVTNTALDCDDNDACTADGCDTASGCTHEQIGCSDGVTCTTDTCDSEDGCINAADDDACDDGDDCTLDSCLVGAGCQHEDDTSNLACAPDCSGLPPGSSCNDGDADTVGDMCLDGGCAGFSVHINNPSDESRLDRVRYFQGAWWATGSDENDGGRGWIAQLGSGGVGIMQNTVVFEDEYTVLTDRVGTTSDGYILFHQNGGWQTSNGLQDNFDNGPVNPWGITAAWGAVLPIIGGGYYLAGQSEGNSGNLEAWIMWCSTSTFVGCISHTVDGGGIGFEDNEIPRAMTGWLLGANPLDFNTLGKMLAADYSDDGESPPYWNDAFANEGASTQWSLSHTDFSGGSQVSVDMHGTDDANVWWTGTGGLLRGRWNQGDGTGWNDLTNMVSGQSDYDFTGVYTDADVVLVAATRDGADQRDFSLVVHDQSGSHDSASSWQTINLKSVDLSLSDDVGAVRDVWRNGDTIVITGYIYDQGQLKTLQLIRQP